MVHFDVELGISGKIIVGSFVVLVTFNPVDLHGAADFAGERSDEG